MSDFIETIIPALTGSPLGSFTIFPALLIPNFDSEVVEQSRWAANWCCVFRVAMERWSGFYCWLIECCLNMIVAMNGDEVSCEWMMFLVQSLVSKQFLQSWLQGQKNQDAIDVQSELRNLNCSVNRFVTILLRSQRLEVIEFCLKCFGDCTVCWLLRRRYERIGKKVSFISKRNVLPVAWRRHSSYSTNGRRENALDDRVSELDGARTSKPLDARLASTKRTQQSSDRLNFILGRVWLKTFDRIEEITRQPT